MKNLLKQTLIITLTLIITFPVITGCGGSDGPYKKPGVENN